MIILPLMKLPIIYGSNETNQNSEAPSIILLDFRILLMKITQNNPLPLSKQKSQVLLQKFIQKILTGKIIFQ